MRRLLQHYLALLTALMMVTLISACAVTEEGFLVVASPQPKISPSPTPSSTPVPLFEYYEVKRGDTLWGISQRVGVDVAILMQVNELEEGAVLTPGQRLLVSDFVTISGEYLPTATPTPLPTATPVPCAEGCRFRVESCAIKAYQARIDGTRLYLVPDDSLYNARSAEIWFCTEAAAQKAGYQHWTEYGPLLATATSVP